MGAVETGTLWGLIVALIPGYRIKLGKPTLRGLRVKMCVWLGVSRGLDLAFLNAD